MHKTVNDLLAEAAIRDIQMRYCRAVDRMDWDLLRACFHADATTDYGFFAGAVEDFIAMAREGLKSYVGTTHFTGNQLVEVKGDSAWAEHYTVATHRLEEDDTAPERDLVTAVRYVDRQECRDGDWRISRRILVLDWWRIDPVVDAGPGPGVKTLARRDASDLSYSLL